MENEQTFMGVLKGAVRGWLSRALTQVKPETLVNPCAGAFSIPWVGVEVGVKPTDIHACDITLYTSALGCYLAGHPLDYELKPGWDWLKPLMVDPASRVAAVVLALRYLQMTRSKKPSIYAVRRAEDLAQNAPLYAEQVVHHTETLKERLAGLNYQPEDMRALIGRHQDNPGAVLCFAPPWYSKGYDKMYEGIEGVFDWEPPDARQFEPGELDDLMRDLAGCKATVLLLSRQEADAETELGEGWHPAFRHVTGSKSSAASTFICNRDRLEARISRDDMGVGASAKYPLFTSGEITTKSKLVARPEKAAVVQYYRDLFVHRLPPSSTFQYYSLFCDGYLLAVKGFKYMPGQEAAAFQIFTYNPRHERYAHLHKLALLSQTSAWFWEQLLAQGALDALLGVPLRIKTSLWCRQPKAMTVRGIFKQTGRERQKDGSYRLVYEAPVVKRTVKETLSLWLSKWGDK